MTPSKLGHLVLYPDRCTQCGRCVGACSTKAIRVGSGYVYVDADACAGCLECVAVCDPRALSPRGRASASGEVGGARVVVGSRAEAKALRKKAVAADKARERSDARTSAQAARVAAEEGRLAEDGTVAWSLVDAGAVLAVLLLSFIAKDAAMSSPAVQLMPEVGRVIVRVLVLAAFYAAQLGVLAFVAARHGARLSSAFGLRGMKRGAARASVSALLVIVLLVVTRAFSFAYGPAAQALGFKPPASAEASIAQLFGVGWFGLALSVLLVVTLGPFVEELIFRGVLLGAFDDAFSTRYPKAGGWLAILLSSLLFSAYHFTAWVFLPLFVLGVALGWLTLARRSIWSAIWLHVLYNLVIVAAAFYIAG